MKQTLAILALALTATSVSATNIYDERCLKLYSIYDMMAANSKLDTNDMNKTFRAIGTRKRIPVYSTVEDAVMASDFDTEEAGKDCLPVIVFYEQMRKYLPKEAR